MTQLLKAVVVSLVIALSLTSDTAQSASQFQVSGLSSALLPPHLGKAHASVALHSVRRQFKVQVREQSCLMNSSVCVASGQMPKSWECQNWTFPPAMPLYGSTPK